MPKGETAIDIAVQGHSFEEVFGSLRKAIALYLQSVADLPADQRPALLCRPVPFMLRLKFLAHALRGVPTVMATDSAIGSRCLWPLEALTGGMRA